MFKNIGFILISTLLLSLSTSALGQDEEKKGEPNFLYELREGALLVRLQDRTAGLKEMEKRGKKAQAEALRERQYQENKEIILSFKNTFTFCPVYFFYAKDSEKIRNRNFNGVIFDENQKTISSRKIPKTFYTAEFSETSQLGIKGLIVMSDKLIPLKAPLPYFKRKYIFFGLISRSKAKMAAAYNSDLIKKYNFHFPDNQVSESGL